MCLISLFAEIRYMVQFLQLRGHSMTMYVVKMRRGGGQKMPVFAHAGGGGGKKMVKFCPRSC